MRRVATALLVIGATALLSVQPASVSAQSVERGIEVEYDKFRDVTSITYTTGLQRDREFTIVIAGECEGDALCQPEVYDYAMLSFEDDWEYLESDNQFYLLLDGSERLQLGELDHSGEVTNGGSVMEVLAMKLSHSTVKKIAGSETVEMKVGLTETELQPKTIAGIAEMVSRVEGAGQ